MSFSLWITLLEEGKKKIFSSGCQLVQHLLAKGLPTQPKTLLLLNFFSKKPLTTADVATFSLDEWGLCHRCFHCFAGANVNVETQPDIRTIKC